ncbi:MAG TPA: hypothetical protein GXX51_02575 [Firmicutes bacterium]|nr:hypothetical protein [Bacillota bacterium]
MRNLFAALLAACAVFILNRYILERARPAFTVVISPFVEEAAKTILALLFAGSIVVVHAIFGIVEAIFDLVANFENGIGAGIVSAAGHLLFGAITFEVIAATGSILVGISVASFTHLAWNLLVLRFLVRG